MYDVIVVGARCGGSPTAMLLARKGYRVLLVDRANFPSDTVSAHLVTAPGVARLARWGLRERVATSGCPSISRVTFSVGDVSLTGSPPALDGASASYCVRRTVLDRILVEAAVEAGAELREKVLVDGVLFEGERVVGIRGRDIHGGALTERAPLVVGADGLHSLIARSVEATRYAERPPLTCFSYAYWGGVPLDGAHFHLRHGRALCAFPTNDDLTCVAVAWPAAEARAFRADVAGNFDRTLDLVPLLGPRVRAGRREGGFVTTADLPNFFRTSHGQGWALVGDAGHHEDPLLARGISEALRDAGFLADAVDAGLSGRRSLAEALADYEVARNEAALPGYEFVTELAQLRPPGAWSPLLRALDGDADGSDRFLGAVLGTIPFAEFHGRERLVGRGAR